jgi:hypothetical protein
MSVQSSGEAKGKKKGTGLLVFFLVVVIAALAVTVVLLLNKNNEKAENNLTVSDGATPEKRNVVVNKENVEELIEDLSEEQRVQPGNYEVTMNTTWNFENGSSVSSNAYVANSEANTNDVYFDVFLSDTGENILKSPVLPIGSHLEEVKLDKALKKGTYDCVIVYSLIDKDQNPLSEVRVGLTINVEN